MKKLMLVTLMAALLPGILYTGCATGKSLGDVVTPARVQAICKYGAYRGAKQVATGGEEAVQALMRASAALDALAKNGSYDSTAALEACMAAGVNLSTPEGDLIIAAGLPVLFDLFTDVSQTLKDSVYAKAVTDGLNEGLKLAIANRPTAPVAGTRAVRPEMADPIELKLQVAAISTRPRK